MSLRAFVDSGGNEWQVFDVAPRTAERRSQERRAREASQATADRRDGDRRFRIADLGRLSTINESWLCFDRESDRRRLSPIPDDWTRCTDEALEDYCRRARPARPLQAGAATH
jgi:hypothetical protein